MENGDAKKARDEGAEEDPLSKSRSRIFGKHSGDDPLGHAHEDLLQVRLLLLHADDGEPPFDE